MSELLAYAVTEEDEGTGGIVFAASEEEAIEDAAGEFFGGEIDGATAYRVEWADAYSPGPVPFRVMFQHGWWQECHYCGQMIREDEYDDGNEISFDITERGRMVFCRPSCMSKHDQDEADRARITKETVANLTESLLLVMPGALPESRHHVYVSRFDLVVQQAIVHFTFPGARIGSAKWRIDKAGDEPRLFVCAGDMRAFRRWRHAGYPPHMMDAPL